MWKGVFLSIFYSSITEDHKCEVIPDFPGWHLFLVAALIASNNLYLLRYSTPYHTEIFLSLYLWFLEQFMLMDLNKYILVHCDFVIIKARPSIFKSLFLLEPSHSDPILLQTSLVFSWWYLVANIYWIPTIINMIVNTHVMFIMCLILFLSIIYIHT